MAEGETTKTCLRESNVQGRLEKELRKLMAKLALNENIEVVWQPDVAKGVSGEVRQSVIFIYETREEEALSALRHELIDYCITSRVVEPLVNLVNLLIKSREAEIYKEKEKLVDVFSKLVDQ